MTKRLEAGSSPRKEQKYKMHNAKLESKKRKQEKKQIHMKEYWDSNPEWQKKKKMMKLMKIERKRKKREQGGNNRGLQAGAEA